MFRPTLPVAVVIFALSGCKSTGQERTAYQLETMQQYRTSLDAGSKQINATMAALDQLTGTTTADLRPLYDKFKAELAKLDADAATTRARAAAMKERAKENLDKWEQETRAEIASPEIRRISDQQRARARERFEELRLTAEGGRDAYNRLSANLHDIQKVLDLSLTQASIESVKPVVETTRGDAQTVQNAIGEVVAKLDNVKSALSTTTGAPVPASGPSTPPSTSP
jgi:uncharacterized protein YPO0396